MIDTIRSTAMLVTMIHLVQILLVLIAILARMATILLLVIVLVILFAMISTNALMVLITAASMHLVPMILEVSVECGRMVTMKTVYNTKTDYKDDIGTAYV